MSEVITQAQIQAKQSELAALVAAFNAQATTSVSLSAVEFSLGAGERYAGAVLDESGQIKHHLILLPARLEEDLNWAAAKAWAADVGGALPDRQEQALLFANCKHALPQRWCWSSEAEGKHYAWNFDFDNGNQYYGHQGSEGGAVAVRRFIP